MSAAMHIKLFCTPDCMMQQYLSPVCCSDTPLKSPAEVDFHLTEAGQDKIKGWMSVVIKKTLTKHCKYFESCKKFIRSDAVSAPFDEMF